MGQGRKADEIQGSQEFVFSGTYRPTITLSRGIGPRSQEALVTRTPVLMYGSGCPQWAFSDRGKLYPLLIGWLCGAQVSLPAGCPQLSREKTTLLQGSGATLSPNLRGTSKNVLSGTFSVSRKDDPVTDESLVPRSHAV